MVHLFYTTIISAHHEIFRAKVGHGGINVHSVSVGTKVHVRIGVICLVWN